MKKLAFILTILCAFSIQAQNTQPSNFRLNSLAKKEILMTVKGLSSSDVGSMTASDFKIGDGTAFTVNSVSYSGQTLKLTLDEDATYWDNIAVRYEGTSALGKFTLSYVTNEILPPTTSLTKYVAVGGSGNGSTEALAMDIEAAFLEANANTTYWIKAGDYGHKHLVINKTLTPTTPVKFIGYKNTIKDITLNYLIDDSSTLKARGEATEINIYNNFSTAEMPTLTGNVLTSTNDRNVLNGGAEDIALDIYNGKYIFIENLQIRQYSQGIQKTGTTSTASHMSFNNINGYDFLQKAFDGNNKTYSYFIDFESQTGSVENEFTNSNNMKFTNIVGADANLALIYVTGYGSNLYENVYLYAKPQYLSNFPFSDARESADYMLGFNGNNSIVNGVYVISNGLKTWDASGVEIHNDFKGGAHGIGVRALDSYKIGGSHYNLFQNSIAVNQTEAFYARNLFADNNVFKNLEASRKDINTNNGVSDFQVSPVLNAIAVWKGDNNIFENIKISGYSTIINITQHPSEDGSSSNVGSTYAGHLLTQADVDKLGSNNIFRNITAKDYYTAVSIVGTDGTIGTSLNNKVVNSNFQNGVKYIAFTKLAANTSADNFDFINTSFQDHTTLGGETAILAEDATSKMERFKFINCNLFNIDGGSFTPINNTNGIAVNPNLDANLKPTETTPTTFTEGGLTTLLVEFDIEGVKRTAPYSIGAYEFGTDTESPKKVTDLSSSDVEQTSLTLTWTASTDDVGVTGYKIFQDDTFLTNVSGDFLSYTVSDLTANTSYNFKVKAFDAAGNESVFSEILSVTTLSNTTANNLYTWDDAVSGTIVSDIINSGWTLYQYGSEGLKVLGNNNNYYASIKATRQETYIYRDYSIDVTSGEEYNIKFKAKVNILNQQKIRLGYDVISTPTLTTSWQQYDYTFTANTTGNVALTFFASMDIPATIGDEINFDDIIIKQVSGTDTVSPTAVTDLSSSTIEETSLTLNWTASTDNVGVVNYKIFQDEVSVGLTGGTTTLAITGLTANTSYNFKVKAFDAAGNESVFSEILSVTTLSNTTANNLYTWDDAVSGTIVSDIINSGWTLYQYGSEGLKVLGNNNNYYASIKATRQETYIYRDYSIDVTSGEEYNIKFKAKVNILNQQKIRLSHDVISTPTLTTSWQQYDYTFTANTTGNVSLSFFVSTDIPATIGDEINFDDIIIEEVNGASKNSNAKRKDKISQFTVYPNPANDSFTIEFSNNNLEKTQITISDVYGRLVYKTETTDNKLKISHNFSHGIYMINIKNNKENVYKKMIIE